MKKIKKPTKRGRGRPKKGDWKQVNIKMLVRIADALAEAAWEKGESQTKYIERAIVRELKKDGYEITGREDV